MALENQLWLGAYGEIWAGQGDFTFLIRHHKEGIARCYGAILK